MEFFIGHRNNLPCLKEENIWTITCRHVIVLISYGSLNYFVFEIFMKSYSLNVVGNEVVLH